jgi:hypothetical protein
VFFVNVPLCLVMAAATPLLPSSEAAASRRLDAVSATLATLGMAALVLAPTFATNDGLVSLEFLGSVAASGVLFVLFVAYERDATDPLVPLSIFRHRALVAGDVVAALLGAWTAAEVLVLALYCQEVLGYSPLVSGLIVVPQGIGGILRGVAGPRVIARVGIRAFLAGSCALSAVCLLFLFRFPVTSRYPLLGVVLLGLGFATTSAIYGATVAGSSGVPNEDQGVAGGLINASRQIGAAIGVAVLLSIVGSGAVSTTQLASRYRAGLAGAGVLAVVATFVGLAAPRRTPGEGDRRHGLASSASSARA